MSSTTTNSNTSNNSKILDKRYCPIIRKYCHWIRNSFFFPDGHTIIWRDYPPIGDYECCKSHDQEREKEWEKNDRGWIYPESDSESLPDIDEKKIQKEN